MAHSADIVILGGLTVSVEFTSQPAEPDVGIFSAWVDDFWITHVKRKDGKNGQRWRKIANTKFARTLESKISLEQVQEEIDRTDWEY